MVSTCDLKFQICVLPQLIVGEKAGAYYQHTNFTAWTSIKEGLITGEIEEIVFLPAFAFCV